MCAHRSPLMVAKRSPVGGDDSPALFEPQQTGVPSERSAQVCRPPLLMEEKRSFSGGDA